MSNTDQQLIDVCLASILKVARRNSSPEELAKALVDTLGVYDASDIAFHINEVEKTIPTNEERN
jgi:hypothetical protein